MRFKFLIVKTLKIFLILLLLKDYENDHELKNFQSNDYHYE